MRYYLSKSDIEDGIVCNIITDITWDTRISDNGFLIRYNFREIISKDIVLVNSNGLIQLRRVKYPESIITLRQSFDEWIEMMTGLNRLFISTNFYESKILMNIKGYSDSVVPYEYYMWFSKRFGPNVNYPLIPKILTKIIKKLEALPMKTNELKKLLTEGNRLEFKFDDKEVVVMPRRHTGFIENPKGTFTKEYEPHHDVYINGVHDKRVPDLNWDLLFHNKIGIRDVWRDLLDLDWPKKELNDKDRENLISNYYVKYIPTLDEDIEFILDGDKEVTKGRTLFEAEELKLRANAPKDMPFAEKVTPKIDSKGEIKEFGVKAIASTARATRLLKKALKHVKPNYVTNNRKLKSNPMSPETEAKITRLDYLKTSNDEIRKDINKRKKDIRSKNHLPLICVKDTQTKVILRIAKDKGNELVNSSKGKYVIVNKQEWKAWKKKERNGVWKDGIQPGSQYTGMNRTNRRKYLYDSPRKGHSTGFTKIVVIEKIIPARTETITITETLPVWEEITRKWKVRDVNGEIIEDVFTTDTIVRRKRNYYQNKKGVWKYKLATETITETREITIPERKTYKTVYVNYPLGRNGRKKFRKDSYKSYNRPVPQKKKSAVDLETT